jgi:hypothetical protein
MYYLYVGNYNMEMVWKFEVMCDKSDSVYSGDESSSQNDDDINNNSNSKHYSRRNSVKSMHILRIKL